MTATANDQTTRAEHPPEDCPKCGKRNQKYGARWTAYNLIPGAPAAGCGNCGHVVYLKKATPFPIYYVDGDGRIIDATGGHA